MPERIAFYSSSDNVIAGRTQNWPGLATAFDLPWLTHDTSAHAPELTPLIIAYLEGHSIAHAIQQLSLIHICAVACCWGRLTTKG